MDLPPSRDEDLHAWALYQARVLRGLASSGASLPNDLDLEHVAEEIEDSGNEQRFQVEGNLVQALMHLVKLAWLPEDTAARHWLKEVAAFRANAADRYTPSMRRSIDLEMLWRRARRRLADELEADGRHLPCLPGAMPFDLDELLDAEVKAPSLVAKLQGAMQG